ncbi:hypothetical protein [Pseudomonas sp. 10S4]|uniref:hypothetical protein n=1 Tax=Pseudomonas sp. 10S4 TaxID=3048583 RepID=UPI002AC97188|nr:MULTISPECIES: hypothetical protein [unclassified Pseudomonas]MEB0226181.1 hypothetical protein [Pseudomonas sp. 5S1]MEB0298611.1 hypothetical protein [Pseudomonas sp. 10S4]WPX20369.1 hypothetical protein RHM58_10920 [Pseudomonas sp. 10S4]
MIDKYVVIVLAVNPIVEEEVLLLVSGVKVKCFASCCPEKIQVGEAYEVEFEIVLPDDDFITVAEKRSDSLIEVKDDGFSCFLYGYLDGSVFRSFVDFMDQEIHYDYPALNEEFVKVRVDRIDVSF